MKLVMGYMIFSHHGPHARLLALAVMLATPTTANSCIALFQFFVMCSACRMSYSFRTLYHVYRYEKPLRRPERPPDMRHQPINTTLLPFHWHRALTDQLDATQMTSLEDCIVSVPL